MSTDPARPWWASADPGVADLDPDEDPVATVRAARRGGPADPYEDALDPSPDTADERQSFDEAQDLPGTQRASTDDEPRGSHTTSAPDPPPGPHNADVCGTCPWCMGVRAVTEARPEVAAHLAEAGRHLAAAMRALLEERPDRGQRRSGLRASDDGPPERREPFERIHIHEEPT